MFLTNGSIGYQFKLGDFGLGRDFTPGDTVSPIPPALSEHQPRVFSTPSYNHLDDLRSVGHLMDELLMTFINMDPVTLPAGYGELSFNLRHRRYSNVIEPLRVAEEQHQQMLDNALSPFWRGNAIGILLR